MTCFVAEHIYLIQFIEKIIQVLGSPVMPLRVKGVLRESRGRSPEYIRI